jgi:hypothetical protein
MVRKVVCDQCGGEIPVPGKPKDWYHIETTICDPRDIAQGMVIVHDLCNDECLHNWALKRLLDEREWKGRAQGEHEARVIMETPKAKGR